jgi:hypothetical protein
MVYIILGGTIRLALVEVVEARGAAAAERGLSWGSGGVQPSHMLRHILAERAGDQGWAGGGFRSFSLRKISELMS